MPFGSLWLPVLVSAVVVFIVSALVHMVLRYHKADHKGLPNEDEVAQAIRKGNPAPGYYMMPHVPEMKDLGKPEVRKRFVEGPRALIALVPSGPPTMSKELTLWFGFNVLVSFVCGYIARHTLSHGADGLDVLRIVGTVAFASYGMGYISDVIWRGIPVGNAARGLIDAVLYGVSTGLIFMWLWPAAA